jgi:RND family efflux transporter MFP subunit
MKYLKSIIAVLAIGGILFWMFSTLNENKETLEEKVQIREEVITEIPVRVAPVVQMKVDNSLKFNGTFEARKELPIIAEGQGRITQLNIKEGQQVSRGQMIAKIDDTNIQAQLTTVRASLEKSRKDVERYERLLKAGAISQQQYEEIKLGYQNAQANVTSIEQQLKYSSARAPMSGVIKEVKVEEGSFATPGSTIATVVDISRLKMIVKVDEKDIIKIREGQAVSITTDVYPDETLNGKVSLISVQADAGRKYEIEIELPNPRNTPLRPGMYGYVSIEPAEKIEKTALFIERKAIVGSVQKPMVYVLNHANEAQYKAVKIGDTKGDKVEVLSGLEKGELVVTTGQINLTDGKKALILNQDSLRQAEAMSSK